MKYINKLDNDVYFFFLLIILYSIFILSVIYINKNIVYFGILK